MRSVGFRLSVADDGRGIAKEHRGAGFGMTSMQERAERIGASLTIVTAPRSGTEVVLAWEPPSFSIPGSGRCCTLTSRPAAAVRASVLVVDDHALLRTGVANIINQESDLRVVAEASNGLEAVEAFERYHPDVTLLDLRMPVMEGVEAVRQIRERDPHAKVIVLTTYDTDDDISRALKAGAKAYVLKDISADGLIECIHDVLAGKTYLAPAAAAKLAEGVTHVQLTPRELATLRLMADGKSNKEIASELGISERTVKTHLGHLFEKLGVASRTEAVKIATRRGLVRLN